MARLGLGFNETAPDGDVCVTRRRPCGALAAPEAPGAAAEIVAVTLRDVGSNVTDENAPASSVKSVEIGAMKILRRRESRTCTCTAGEVEVTSPPRACQPKSGWSMMTVPMPSECPTKFGP